MLCIKNIKLYILIDLLNFIKMNYNNDKLWNENWCNLNLIMWCRESVQVIIVIFELLFF